MLKGFASRLLDVVFPPKCDFCNQLKTGAFCSHCYSKNSVINKPVANLDLLIAPLEYKNQVRSTILTLKSTGNQWAVKKLSDSMLVACKDIDFTLKGFVVLPVPSSLASLKQKGFNHSQLLGECIAESLNLPLATDYLKHNDSMPKQHTLNYDDRFANAQKAFVLGKDNLKKGTNILLIDDVYTTGATLSSCAGILKAAGANQVIGLTSAITMIKEGSQHLC